MADRYNIYDWVGDRSKLRLQQLLSKYDIKVDETKQNKQQVLSQVLNTLSTAEEVFELKKIFLAPDPLDKNFIEAQNEEKKLIELQCNVAIKRKQIQLAINEAVSTYVIAEEMKKLHDLIKDFDKRVAAEKDQQLQAMYQADADNIQQQLRENLSRLQNQAMSDMLQHKENIEKLDKEIAGLREKKQATFANGAVDAVSELKQKQLESGKYLNDYMTDNQAIMIQEEIAREIYKSKKTDKKEVENIDKELNEIKDKKAELKQAQPKGHSQSTSFMPGFKGAQKSVSAKTSIEIAKLEEREKVLEHRKEQILNADPKAKEQEYGNIAVKAMENHGVAVDQIPQKDKEGIVSGFVDAANKIADEALVVRDEKKVKKAEKVSELQLATETHDAYVDGISDIKAVNEAVLESSAVDIQGVDIQNEMDDFFATFGLPSEESINSATSLKK